MNILDDLIIACRTTCGCGSGLVPYTKQTETTHYLLTCKPYSERYNHPLLIEIDKKSPLLEDSRILSKIDRYCTGKETVDVIKLLQLGLRGR